MSHEIVQLDRFYPVARGDRVAATFARREPVSPTRPPHRGAIDAGDRKEATGCL